MRKHFNPSKPIKIKKPWSKKKKIIVIASVVVGVAALAVGGFFVYKTFFAEQPFEQTAVIPEPVRYYSPLTGIETSEDKTKRPVTAVMIENSPEARPQSGLYDAGVVFEAVAEGGITRFIALYQEADVDPIGPVRSARPYYLEWAAAFDPSVAHVGGSAQALQMLSTGSYGLNIDEQPADDVIYRASGRYAPHDAYTSTGELLRFEAEKGKTASSFTAWDRIDGKIPEPTTTTNEAGEEIITEPTLVTDINVPVSYGQFNDSYTFDRDTNRYLRFQGGAAHLDREKGQIAPNTVIAMMVNMGLMSDGLHNQITTIGSGKAYIFQNGGIVEGTWSKASASAQIKFTDAEGNEIKLNRGQTWISAVPNGNVVTWR
ncbi:hypothetical protein FACS189431_1260 [Alphaproteobacteria bacterium]|nr:hypothetical protein FACS189431_1260 [Alphaproteobacteria bacterium]